MEQFQLDGWKILYLVVAFLSVVKALTKEIRVLSNQGENNPGAYTSCMIVLFGHYGKKIAATWTEHRYVSPEEYLKW